MTNKTNHPSEQTNKRMDTRLTIDEIQLALRNSGIWNKRQDIFIPNLSWGLLDYEADFVIMSVSVVDMFFANKNVTR